MKFTKILPINDRGKYWFYLLRIGPSCRVWVLYKVRSYASFYRWKKRENFEYELYDHRNDKKEFDAFKMKLNH